MDFFGLPHDQHAGYFISESKHVSHSEYASCNELAHSLQLSRSGDHRSPLTHCVHCDATDNAELVQVVHTLSTESFGFKHVVHSVAMSKAGELHVEQLLASERRASEQKSHAGDAHMAPRRQEEH